MSDNELNVKFTIREASKMSSLQIDDKEVGQLSRPTADLLYNILLEYVVLVDETATADEPDASVYTFDMDLTSHHHNSVEWFIRTLLKIVFSRHPKLGFIHSQITNTHSPRTNIPRLNYGLLFNLRAPSFDDMGTHIILRAIDGYRKGDIREYLNQILQYPTLMARTDASYKVVTRAVLNADKKDEILAFIHESGMEALRSAIIGSPKVNPSFILNPDSFKHPFSKDMVLDYETTVVSTVDALLEIKCPDEVTFHQLEYAKPD